MNQHRLALLQASHVHQKIIGCGRNHWKSRRDRQIKLFSGGNQQKAIIARWLAAGSRILLFDEPTRGIDVGAKSEIYHLIEDLAADGHCVIVVSSELPEVMRVSDRVLVMRDGAIVAELGRDQLSEAAIVSHAVGTTDSRVGAAVVLRAIQPAPIAVCRRTSSVIASAARGPL